MCASLYGSLQSQKFHLNSSGCKGRSVFASVTMPNTPELMQKDEAKNESEFGPERRQHVPYILNGELYRIQSQDGDNVKVICCYCSPDKIYRGSVRSTGNFHMHIKRRHTSLLGKLHEMKVAALVERRDRIMKNRRFARTRKKITTTSLEELATKVATKIDMVDNNAELKIKTVYQRHKQEHNEQQEGIRNSISSSTSTVDENVQVCSTNFKINSSLNVKLVPEDLRNVHHQNANKIKPNILNNSLERTIVPVPQAVLLGHFKPEQTNLLTASLNGPQPEAMDLSSTSCKHANSSFLSAGTTDKSSNTHGHPLEDISVQLMRSRELSIAHYINNSPPKDIMLRLDRTLSDIRHELNTRNEIEHKRLLFEAAKFKYLNPNFRFE